MTTTEWFTDIALILIVFRQLREGRLGPRSYLLPLGIVSFVAYKYLHTVPTGGNDLVLIGALVGVGVVLGVSGGVLTRIRTAGEHVLIKAGVVSAVLWERHPPHAPTNWRPWRGIPTRMSGPTWGH